MRLAINLILSLGVLALCTWLVWPDAAERTQLHGVIHALDWAEVARYLAVYFALQVVVMICRSLRWNHLLAPLGVKVPAGPILAISAVGFMAILALPARLGEFVRPGLLSKGRYASAAAALGTVAVERIIDGLVISLLVFVLFFAHHGPGSPGWMMFTAYLALGGFGAALVFLVFAMRWPKPTVTFCLRLTLLPRFAPRLAQAIEHKLLDMIRGFAALKDVRNLGFFMVWSAVYWIANGVAVWVLAQAFHLDLSMAGAFATMGLLGLGISLPNSPGMIGQFQWFTLLGLSLYLGFDPSPTAANHGPVYAAALAFSIAQHLLQVIWYVGMGGLGLATPWVSFHDLWSARKGPDDEPVAETPAAVVSAGQAAAAVTPVERPRGWQRAGSGGHAKKLAPEARSADDPLHAPDRS